MYIELERAELMDLGHFDFQFQKDQLLLVTEGGREEGGREVYIDVTKVPVSI